MKKADAYEQSGTHTCTARCVRVESAPTAIGCQKWTFVRGSRDRQDGELRLGQDLCVSTIKKGFYSLFYERKRSEEHTSELQSLMRISYAVFCLKKQNNARQYEVNRT